MRYFLQELRSRNSVLYYFGWLCLLAAAIACILLLTGPSALLWVRPLRFLVSTALFVWTIAWLLHYLGEKRAVLLFSWLVLIVLLYENSYTVVFALYFLRTGSPVPAGTDARMMSLFSNALLFISAGMGWFTLLFFRRSPQQLKRHYLWGIRFGMLFFVLFSFSGNLLSTLPGWDPVSYDGGKGLPMVNWRQDNPGLELAHFMGMHALQVLPFFSYYIGRRSIITILFSIVYFLAIAAIFAQSVLQRPLIELYLG